jgi:hypothetical protein
MHGRIGLPRPAAPVGLAAWRVLAAAAALMPAGCSGGGESPVDYRPPASVERLAVNTFELPGVASVHDFDVAADRLYLLERWGRVLMLRRAAGGWEQDGAVGRRGSGPGEFESASGIAFTGAGFVVAEPHRLQHFSDSGAVVSSRRLSLPCAMSRPALAAGAGGLFIHGNCVRSAYVTDTMKAVLAWAAGDDEFVILAEDVRFTRDGTAGSVFGASRALTPGAAGRHVFGPGTANCITVVEEGTAGPAVRRRCPAVAQLYRADPPPDVERRLRAGVPGLRVTWPAALPAYVDRLIVDDAIVLLRPFAADSVVLQTASPDGRDLAVAPFDGLVGCRALGCLWIFEDASGVRAWFLDADRIRRLMQGGGGV